MGKATAATKGSNVEQEKIFRTNMDITSPNQELIAKFSKIPAANISDASGNLNTMNSGIQSLTLDTPICGPACTVTTRAGDFLAILKGLNAARPGDVLVIDSQGSPDVAVFGEVTATEAKMKGLAGLVADGKVRDIDGIRKLGFPVFARGTSPRVAGRTSLGEVNIPIQCGGVVVHPGDIILGDSDGVVVVPWQKASEILKLSQAIVRFENDLVEKVRAGVSQMDFFGLEAQFESLYRAHLKGHGESHKTPGASQKN